MAGQVIRYRAKTNQETHELGEASFIDDHE